MLIQSCSHVWCVLIQVNSFLTFDKEWLIRFAKFYLLEFQDRDVKNDPEFSNVKGIDELAQKLVKNNKVARVVYSGLFAIETGFDFAGCYCHGGENIFSDYYY